MSVRGGSTIWSGERRELPWGLIAFEWPHVTLCSTHHGEQTIKLPGTLPQTPFLEMYWTEAAVFAAEAGGSAVLFNEGDRLCVHEITRVPNVDHYDSGVHALRFYGITPTSVVLSTEVAVSVLDGGDIRWSYVHGDVTNRVLGVTGKSVELRGETTATSLDLHTGAQSIRAVRGTQQHRRTPPVPPAH